MSNRATGQQQGRISCATNFPKCRAEPAAVPGAKACMHQGIDILIFSNGKQGWKQLRDRSILINILPACSCRIPVCLTVKHDASLGKDRSFQMTEQADQVSTSFVTRIATGHWLASTGNGEAAQILSDGEASKGARA